MRPDPGRALQESVLGSMSAMDRTARMAELRRNGLWSVWRQVDAANLTDAVEQAEFILRRLYPEESEAWFETVVGQLRADHAAGRWNGFKRPEPPGKR
jgi:hypothetical protein